MRSTVQHSRMVAIPLVACCLLIAQCSSDSTAPEEPAPAHIVSATVDSAGGEIWLGTEAWVIIPAGALDTTVTITITRSSDLPRPPMHYLFPSYGYSFTPHGQTFTDSVTIGMACDTTLTSPMVTRLDDEDDSTWERVDNAIVANATAIFRSMTFSTTRVAEYHPLEEIYVSRRSSGLEAAGTQEDPLPTIAMGIQASLDAGEPYPPVLVAEDTYQENLTFVAGVDIHGGYDEETWLVADDAYSEVRLVDIAAQATDLADTTLITGLHLRAAGAVVASGNAVALFLVDCGPELRFERCRFEAVTAATGQAGTKGSTGTHGSTGSDGSEYTGGAGGADCHAGGRGGNGFAVAGLPGSLGTGPSPGLGGLGGIIITGEEEGKGSSGTSGGRGSVGTHGTPTNNAGTAGINGWSPFRSGNGTSGTCGSGGGGGGGGTVLIWPGGGGGGGGGGGFGGLGGQGGLGGGSSFAVYLYESDPVFVDCSFESGRGGRGGIGGDGGDGGGGGTGGLGAGHGEPAGGGRGGWGGDGGRGGGGAGGPGGHSYCLYLVGTTSQLVTLINSDYTVGSPGQGGLGGATGASRAPRGPAGTSGAVGP